VGGREGEREGEREGGRERECVCVCARVEVRRGDVRCNSTD
jgi:hypothetical protein